MLAALHRWRWRIVAATACVACLTVGMLLGLLAAGTVTRVFHLRDPASTVRRTVTMRGKARVVAGKAKPVTTTIPVATTHTITQTSVSTATTTATVTTTAPMPTTSTTPTSGPTS